MIRTFFIYIALITSIFWSYLYVFITDDIHTYTHEYIRNNKDIQNIYWTDIQIIGNAYWWLWCEMGYKYWNYDISIRWDKSEWRAILKVYDKYLWNNKIRYLKLIHKWSEQVIFDKWDNYWWICHRYDRWSMDIPKKITSFFIIFIILFTPIWYISRFLPYDIYESEYYKYTCPSCSKKLKFNPSAKVTTRFWNCPNCWRKIKLKIF